MDWIIAVSYTHLDVYKRQILGYLILAFVIAGGVKLISYRKRIRLDIRLLALPQTGWGKIVLGNPGMILGLASAITVYVLNLIAVSKI